MFISTRNNFTEFSFEHILLGGLANDGGLYLPSSFPTFTESKWNIFSKASYQNIGFEIVKEFIDTNGRSQEDLKKIIHQSYQNFNHPAIAPLTPIKKNLFFLELFHSPTYAFKDYALQFLSRIFDYYNTLNNTSKKNIVLGATSGDTGSAAIEAFKSISSVEVFILHPHEKISALQRKQMTTVTDTNIHNLAIQGNFDDCQKIVKTLFKNQGFLPKDTHLMAINSINWVRIMAQMVYYVFAYVKSGAIYPEPVIFSVPTGNFGNILAGYLASKMGLPIKKLILGTNENDILHRLINQNDYSIVPLKETYSPSMDIIVASNLERYLYCLYQNSSKIVDLMKQFETTGKLSLDPSFHRQMQKDFDSFSSSNQEILETIKKYYQENKMIIDPHSAVAFNALEKSLQTTKKNDHLDSVKKIVIGTAHPAKFHSIISKAGIPNKELKFPDPLMKLKNLKEKFKILPKNPKLIELEILKNL